MHLFVLLSVLFAVCVVIGYIAMSRIKTVNDAEKLKSQTSNL